MVSATDTGINRVIDRLHGAPVRSRTSYMFWLGEEGESLRPTSTIRESSDPVRIPDMFDPAHSWDVVI